MDKYVIERLEKVKDVVISYNFWMSSNKEELLSLTAHYCTVTDRKNTHIGIPSITATDGVSLHSSVMEVVENFGLEAKIVKLF